MRKIWIIIFLVILLDIVAFSSVLPLFPLIFEYYNLVEKKKYGVHYFILTTINNLCEILNIPISQKFISVLFGGLLGSLFSFLQFLSAPICGYVADNYGRKPVLIVCMLGISTSYYLWSQSICFSTFMLSRIIGGLCKSNISILTTIATDCSEPKDRGKIMALIGAAFSMGFIVGPLIGGIMASRYLKSNEVVSLSHYSYDMVAYLSLFLSILNLFLVYFFLPETLQNYKFNKHGSIWVIFKNIIRMKKVTDYINPYSLFTFRPCFTISGIEKSKLQSLGCVYFLYLLLFSGMEFTLTFFTHLRFKYNSMDQGKMFCFIGFVMVIVQGGFLRQVPPCKEKKFALMALILIIPANVIIALSHNRLTFYTGLLIYSLSTSMAVPTLTSLVSYYGKQNQKGVVMGIHRSLGALARTIGPLFFSFLFWSIGPTYCYLLGSILQIIPPIVYYRNFLPN
ncbi:major facilitator superfamily domain-containing protein 10-like [Gordionus sp. m RMFG-2023]|uniref:major facilitator superfamily domain-containing protein 10-like n=1 Tax=Gordionus sp. m RMFG-2023 TaxID=3053472 RepID=UPI0031FE0B36